MTPDMKFEALLVSPDLQTLKGVLETLEDLSIEVDVCMSLTRAVDVLTKRNVDLVVIDCEKKNGAEEVAKAIGSPGGGRRTTIAALVDDSFGAKQIREAGAHVVIQKPLNGNFRSEFHTRVYSRMVREWRQHPRYGVRWLVAAKDRLGDTANARPATPLSSDRMRRKD